MAISGRRLAVVDHQQGALWALSDAFRARGWYVDFFADADVAARALRDAAYDVAIVNAGPSGSWAFEVLQGLHEHGHDTEAIVLAGEDFPWDRIGAATPRPFAYFPSSVDPGLLVAEVDRAHELQDLRRENRLLAARVLRYEQELQGRIEEATRQLATNRELAEANRDLRTLATHDELTGLYNYRHFASRLREEVERARRYGASFGLAVLDIDHFKGFNDTYGHVAGNQALSHVATHLTQHLRMHDVAARIGGEEFAALLFHCDRPQLGLVCERVRQALEVATCPDLPGEATGGVTVSVGAAMCPDDGQDPSTLLERADHALYTAKGLGRNRLVMWETALSSDGYCPTEAPADRTDGPAVHGDAGAG